MRFRNVIQRMRYIRIVSFGSLLLIVVLSSAGYATEKDAMTLRLGGCGGVYFYASAGELWVDMENRPFVISRRKICCADFIVCKASTKKQSRSPESEMGISSPSSLL